MSAMVKGVRHNRLTMVPESEVDYELDDPNALLSTHGNAIPMPGNVQIPRTFYGSRFFESALPLVKPEAPLVRNLENKSGRSFDFVLGEAMGARRAKKDGIVEKVTPDGITLRTPEGLETVELFNLYPGNRKTLKHNTPVVKEGQPVKAGDLLARSNFTDEEGRMAIGRNAVIGLAPYLGHSMDDAVVISKSFAEGLRSDHAETVEHDFDETYKLGKNHFTGLFRKKFSAGQLENIDDDGIIKPGVIVQPGDPLMLMTRPRNFSSSTEGTARLSRTARFIRKDASKVWDGDDPAEILSVARTRGGGYKIFLRYTSPARGGDKIVLRNGQKGTISKIIDDDQMPRTESGQKLDVILNQLGLPSRVNSSSFYELMLGKVAAKRGKAYTLPQFLPKGVRTIDFVRDELAKNGVEPKERVYDPKLNKWLENPISVGNAYVMRLHHIASGKLKSRGQGGYSLDHQPLKGGGAAGGAQRMSGLEMNVLHSAGARGVQKEAVLLRGEDRQEYWRAMRANRPLPKLDKPFVWEKFRALLSGTGINTKELGNGRLRLAPMTDKDLDALGSRRILNEGIVDLKDFSPKPGGLFDPQLVRDKKWGHVELPFPVINPSYEETVRILLGLTKAEYEALLEDEKNDEA